MFFGRSSAVYLHHQPSTLTPNQAWVQGRLAPTKCLVSGLRFLRSSFIRLPFPRSLTATFEEGMKKPIRTPPRTILGSGEVGVRSSFAMPHSKSERQVVIDGTTIVLPIHELRRGINPKEAAVGWCVDHFGPPTSTLDISVPSDQTSTPTPR